MTETKTTIKRLLEQQPNLIRELRQLCLNEMASRINTNTAKLFKRIKTLEEENAELRWEKQTLTSTKNDNERQIEHLKLRLREARAGLGKWGNVSA